MKELPAEGVVTQDFYTEVNYIADRSTHQALDIVNSNYVPIRALFSGIVLLNIDNVPDGAFISENNYSGYGNERWIVSYNGRVKQRVAHLMQGSPVQEGWKIKSGMVIGTMGQTGYRFPESVIHTHYEIYLDGVRVDPYSNWEQYLEESLTENQMSELETRVSKLEAQMEVLKGGYKKTKSNVQGLRRLAFWKTPKLAKKAGVNKPKTKPKKKK